MPSTHPRLRQVLISLSLLAPLFVSAPAHAQVPGRAAPHARRLCPVVTAPSRAGCFAWVRTDTAGVISTATGGVPTGYGPAEFRAAYGLPSTGGANQTIAIVDAYRNPKIYDDLKNYDAAFGLGTFPRCTKLIKVSCFAVLNQQGLKSPLPATDVRWALEEALDVEIAHGLCPECRINLMEAKSDSFADLEAAVNAAAAKHATVISNSYGSYGNDCSEPGYDHKRIAVVVAAGDGGFGIACPAALNTVISVGGTGIRLNTDGTWAPEGVWGGTGSGCSAVSLAPAWQSALPNWAATGCGAGRAMNDVAADANPASGAAVYDTWDKFDAPNRWVTVGGTSLSAPIIAAIYALAGNAKSWKYPAQSLYAAPSALRDVKLGENGTCAIALQCQAGLGYDLPTGLGSPAGLGAF